MTFGEKIIELRRSKNMSIRQAAAELNFSPAYLHSIETNKQGLIPSDKILKIIAGFYRERFGELKKMALEIDQYAAMPICGETTLQEFRRIMKSKGCRNDFEALQILRGEQ
jgi:transcriptional regulator with XRE-family HTH domain